MKRRIIDELIRWKTEDSGKPVLLTGLKGVGKTYLAYDFAKAFFECIYYINFEREPVKAELFQPSASDTLIKNLIDYLHIESGRPIETRILILDEIGCCPDALTMLKACDLSSIFRFVIYISSSPVVINQTDELKNIPVYPLEFDEFLQATGNEWYIESIATHFHADTKIPDIVHKELLALHRLYLQIGGMPGAVNEYLNLSSVVNVAEQHNILIGSYHDSITRYNPDSDTLKMNQVLDSLSLQLMKENKKFQYNIIRKGTTHSMYKDAINKLCDNHYVIKSNRINTDQLQNSLQSFHFSDKLSVEENPGFKLYFPDTGFLYTKLIGEQGLLPDGSQMKTLLENYVAQSLMAHGYPFAFWESESMSKIDFIYLKEQHIIPIEIFDNDKTRSKNISVLKQKCDFPYAVKISSRNFEFSNQIKYVPSYAVFCL